MATVDLSRDSFALLSLTGEIVNGKPNIEHLGYFSCRSSVTRYLEMETLVSAGESVISERRVASSRSVNLVDGGQLTTSTADKEEGGSTTLVKSKQSQVLKSNGAKGSKSVRLKATKLVDPTKPGKYHQVSFRFPGWATNLIISNALGLLLPSGTIATPIADGKLYPYFISPGGKRYPIATKLGADTAQIVAVATSPAALTALISESGQAGTQSEPAQE
ncbi:MAG: hypothetical protein V7L26_00760 [Nostoc sp.]|uniref:hypothetical protein n=1 Tax=Nostoc sp. TaxID=1180 RepID=UPI002FF00127